MTPTSTKIDMDNNDFMELQSKIKSGTFTINSHSENQKIVTEIVSELGLIYGKNEKLENENIVQSAKITELTTKNENLETNMNSATVKKDELSKKSKKLTEDLNKAKDDIETLTKEKKDLIAKNNDLSKDQSTISVEYEQLKKDYELNKKLFNKISNEKKNKM
jgi:chromosome segregation ATPase